MKKTYIYKRGVAALFLSALTGVAVASVPSLSPESYRPVSTDATTVCGVEVSGAAMQRNSGLMAVDMTFGLGTFGVQGNRAVVFTPLIVNGTDTLALQPVGLYSRTRWYQYLRSGAEPLGGEAETSVRWSDRPELMSYSQVVPYAEWMNGAQLVLKRSDYGCCRTLLDEQYAALAGWREVVFVPVYRYAQPTPETAGMGKVRELSGRAFIDFPVNRTELHADYRKNPVELAKIIATIDSVRNDKDVTVNRITIKGYASPESSWDNNTRLAKGRTATLKQYVQNLYRFPDNFIETDYEPEDWEGLRAFVAQSGLEHKSEILAIIDDKTLEPDPKEWRLKSKFPEEYRFLLATVYPGLRHSDYTIEYTIRQFTDIADIRRVMAEAPQKLSLDEMYTLAQTMEPGSDEYNEVFETAVRMYPNDKTANLNAANAAMTRNDMVGAEKYLAKAGNSAEAVYARGIYAALQKDYDKAITLIRQSGLPNTQAVLEQLEELKLYR